MKKLRKNDRCYNYPNLKRIALVLLFLTFLILILYYSTQNNTSKVWTSGSYKEFDALSYKIPKDSKFAGEKIVHIDLKGAPPKISYYEKLFPLLSKLGATGLLIEYEDMFPYQGPLLANISARNAYSLNDIKMILNYAEKSGLIVIPLIQTFGHMEFILKLKDFVDLREVPEYPQVVCPTHGNTLTIIMEMVDQIARAHPKMTKLHIGADEVWFIGTCDRCLNILNKYGWSNSQLFLEHITTIAHKIHSKYPNLRILMWDDKFRGMTLTELKESQVSTMIEPVIWKYTKDVYEDLGFNLWNMYAQIFRKVWIASAFKGATGSSQYVTDITHHLQNHRSWMTVVSDYEDKIKFEGIFLTGWQRYDHFAVLCELLPVGIPSLALNLRLLSGFNESPLSPPTEVAKVLQCEQPYGLIGSSFGFPRCSFPGGDVLEIVLKFHQLKERVEAIQQESRVKGWMADYNVRHDYSNPYYVETGTELLASLRAALAQMQLELSVAMQEVYDNYTINEWKFTFVKPLAIQIENLWNARQKLLSKNYWPRQPIVDTFKEDL